MWGLLVLLRADLVKLIDMNFLHHFANEILTEAAIFNTHKICANNDIFVAL